MKAMFNLYWIVKRRVAESVSDMGSIHTKSSDFRTTTDDSAKGGLTQFRELFTVIPCARKDFKR